MLGIFYEELKININYWKFTSKGFLNFIKTVFQNTEGRTFLLFSEKSQSLLKSIFLSQILKIFKTIILKMLGFFAGFFSIFPEKGDRFPVDSATQHSRTIFFRLLMNLSK